MSILYDDSMPVTIVRAEVGDPLKRAEHVSGSPVVGTTRSLLTRAIAGEVVGLHVDSDDGIHVLTKARREDGALYFAIQSLTPQGRSHLPRLAGSRRIMVAEFERRSGQTWGRPASVAPGTARGRLEAFMRQAMVARLP